jgi:hypothetical protein
MIHRHRTYQEYEAILGPELCRRLWERTYNRDDTAPIMLAVGTRWEGPLTVQVALVWANRLAGEFLR